MANDEPPPTLGPTGQGPLAHVALAAAPTTPPRAPAPRQTCHTKALAIAATADTHTPTPQSIHRSIVCINNGLVL
ncbi:hypothetical protein E2562_033268 [Oryza meyeriana var. granulata]|uniref:Uncharacterized protein n=1 Tax=Oryza meyeriana var. granulata TaxID=110450 RepID=A0A6G1CW59_9ORYZ|nr:hypothetical protein E2562_033268 [Oryza meyeriana var. granulata]